MGDELNFNFDDNEEIFEDIVSDSGKVKEEEQISFLEMGKKHTKRKKHGKFRKWWSGLSRGKRALSITGCVVFLLVALIIINPFHMLEHILYNFDNITDDTKQYGFESKINEDIINIALFGIDTRNKNTFRGNSDSIMILSLNTKEKSVKILSVVRDTIISITDISGKRRYGKLNSAYANSPETAIRTLNETFNLDISEYAVVNFYGMSEIIDAVGGIDITVTEDELRFHGKTHPNLNGCMDEICKNLNLNPNNYHINKTGKQHVNGIQAVAYSRIRSSRNIWGTNNDYGRTDRQRYVMEQLFNKAVKLKKGDYPKLAKALIPCTQTSLELNQVLSIAYNVLLNNPTFYQARIPQEDWLMTFRWSGYGSVVYYDLDYAARAIHSVIYENKTIEEFVEINGVEKTDWFASVGSRVTTKSSNSSQKANSSTASGTSSVTSSADNTSPDNQTTDTTPTEPTEPTTPTDPTTPTEPTTPTDPTNPVEEPTT